MVEVQRAGLMISFLGRYGTSAFLASIRSICEAGNKEN